MGELVTPIVPAAAAAAAASVDPLGDLDTTNSPAALWLFDDGLTDSSGNGLTLTASTGSAEFRQFMGKKWLWLDGAKRFSQTAAALRISGDVTLFAQFVIMSESTTTEAWFGMTDEGGTSVSNYQYLLWQQSGFFYYSHQYGTKTGSAHQLVKFNKNGLAGSPHTVAVVRDATARTLDWYIDGQFLEQDSYGAGAVPTGGSSTNFHLGANSADTQDLYDVFLRNVAVYGSALTAGQVDALNTKAAGG